MTVRETVNATKERFGAKDLAKLFDGSSKVVAAKGKKIVDFSLKDTAPDDADLVKIVLGPTGNLRAPSIKKGATWIVGFNEELYAEHF